MMREEDLIRIAKNLDKMVSRNNTEDAMDLLRELRGFNMTLKLLQDTRIGMSVNGIRKHSTDEEVIALAKLLIKDWKRLRGSEKPADVNNGLEAAVSPNSFPSETHGSHRRLDVKPKHDSDLDKKPPDKTRKEKHSEEHKDDKKHPEEPQNEKHPQEIRKEKHLEKQGDAEDTPLLMDNKKQKHRRDLQSERFKPEPEREGSSGEPKKRHMEEVKREKRPGEPKRHSYADDMKKDKHREENRHRRPISSPQWERTPSEPQREKPAGLKPIFERRGVMDGTVLYPTRFPSPPRPARPPLPIKRPSVDLNKDRKDSKDSSSRHPRPLVPPPAKRPSLEVKKERKAPPDPKAPIAPLPLHLHPPAPRKEPRDPNAPLPPLPLHLHPPPPPPLKRPSLEGKKDSRKESSDSKAPPQKKTPDPVKRDRKDSSDSKVPKKHSEEVKSERKDSSDSKPPLLKKPSLDVKKEKHRKESCDSKPCQPVKRQSTDSKPDRRESTDSKKSSSPPAKKLTVERRESQGSKTSQAGPPLRKPSADTIERKSKTDTPKTPTTPTSPMSPSFSSAGGPLPPHLATGDSVRDKCIDMLAAALRTADDFKDFRTDCDSTAAEIEDHIYQETKAVDMKYKNRVRSRISNLKDPKNPGLRRNVLAGNIDLRRIATMSAEEMASDELKQLRNVLTQEAIREHQMAKTGGTSTDLLQCDNCRKSNCTYNQVQTRSADEPMTTFVLCNECGYRWKFC
ncbi:transcription elongation factor A protein 3 isoform X3 [Pseudoliparis swirei]|uniref:transcription elongation factor A protein 3 isoform X3 n=1 Tax=Pseudoliparis swirei TaxID=2059687 RepID=UPI0024BDB4DD|nr:transcription elongation factor A protein 3 isoform X3 [Pseudoliparis swirei]